MLPEPDYVKVMVGEDAHQPHITQAAGSSKSAPKSIQPITTGSYITEQFHLRAFEGFKTP